MRMDLVDRKALRRRVQKVSTEAWKMKMTAQVETVMNQFLDFLEQAPAVEAVPLEPLCEWLGGQGMLAPCYFDQKCDGCELKAYWRQKKSECWKQCLTNWMEGQHE